MSKLTADEQLIINRMLYKLKESILESVNESLEELKKDNKDGLIELSKSIRMIAKISSEAKATAEKAKSDIEGNGSIGIKTQVRSNNAAIKELEGRFNCSETESLKEKIEEGKNSGELEEKKYDRRAEDKRAKRKDYFYLAAVLITTLSGIFIQIGVAP